MNCVVCKTKLVGKQRKFCSNNCKSKTNNVKFQNHQRQKERGLWYKSKLILLLGGKCSVCGYNKNYAALSFHHVNPKLKSFTLDSRSISNRSWNAVCTEAKKCILVCQNCHQEIHYPHFNRENINPNDPSIKKIQKPKKKCLDCGKRIHYKNERCSFCSHAKQEKICWPPTKELLEQLKTHSYLDLAKKLGISDNAIRKRIKNHPPKN